MSVDLWWLPTLERLETDGASSWADFVALANHNLDLAQTGRLARALDRAPAIAASLDPRRKLKLAVVGSSTASHLAPSLRIAAVRRNLHFEVHLGDYGQYVADLLGPQSTLQGFAPDFILLALDARHLFADVHPAWNGGDFLEAKLKFLRGLWRAARDRFGAQVIQQTVMPVFDRLAGNNEHRLPGAPADLVRRFNAALIAMAEEERVDVLDLEAAILRGGLSEWHDPVFWHRAKQEIRPLAAPVYGDHVARLIAARRGLSHKCLALDLDNTLWGGVIGDDGIAGIKLGQGSAIGEAHVAFQRYCLDLSSRGVVLAVCSKNDEKQARLPFDNHPDMVLRMEHIGCFVANWDDKATNLRRIADRLNIGIDSIVFADDNPFERAIVRREAPAVAVPELPEDPALYSAALADAGYFEAVAITKDDFARSAQYQANLKRGSEVEAHTDMDGYLASLDMKLSVKAFDEIGLERIVQLINKTNQFNLTTRRVTEQQARHMMADPDCLTFQCRLLDKFGDNGMISVVAGNVVDDKILELDVWLMSCRVIGRKVEQAIFNRVVAAARQRGVTTLIGRYKATEKNGMVRDFYKNLGFAEIESDGKETMWRRELEGLPAFETAIEVLATE